MDNEDSLCSSLNNSLVQQGDKAVKNSNSYQVHEMFPESYLEQTNEEQNVFKNEISEQGNRKQSMTSSEDITLDQDLHNCSAITREIKKECQTVEDSDKNVGFEKIKQKSHKDCNSYSTHQGQPCSTGCVQNLISSEHARENTHNSLEKEDIDENVMSASYGEISLDRDLLSSNKNSDLQSSKEDLKNYPSDENKSESFNEELVKEKKRPDSLILTKNVFVVQSDNFVSSTKEEAFIQQINKSQQTSECRTSAEVSPSLSSEEFALHSMGHTRSESDTSGLSELLGTLTVDGDLVTFVAEDLQEKIKMSSPVSRITDSCSFPGSRSSTPSLYRQALQPQFHIVDPHVISDVESYAKKIASVVDTMLNNLSETLQSFSSLTVACMKTYESSVCKTCDSVDGNIKSVYQLMAKCEELSNSMQPLYEISGEVKHIKKMLDQLENVVEHKF